MRLLYSEVESLRTILQNCNGGKCSVCKGGNLDVAESLYELTEVVDPGSTLARRKKGVYFVTCDRCGAAQLFEYRPSSTNPVWKTP